MVYAPYFLVTYRRATFRANNAHFYTKAFLDKKQHWLDKSIFGENFNQSTQNKKFKLNLNTHLFVYRLNELQYTYIECTSN